MTRDGVGCGDKFHSVSRDEHIKSLLFKAKQRLICAITYIFTHILKISYCILSFNDSVNGSQSSTCSSCWTQSVLKILCDHTRTGKTSSNRNCRQWFSGCNQYLQKFPQKFRQYKISGKLTTLCVTVTQTHCHTETCQLSSDDSHGIQGATKFTVDCSQFQQCCMELVQTGKQVSVDRPCLGSLVHNSTYNTNKHNEMYRLSQNQRELVLNRISPKFT